MKIQYCSDLHLEFLENHTFIIENPIKVCGEILIIAGDLLPISKINYTVFNKEISVLCQNFEKVFWIPGNHEYYLSFHQNENNVFKKPIPSIPNLFMVDNYSEIIGNTKFIFSTLWSDISEEKAPYIAQYVNDFRQILIVENDTNEAKLLEINDFNKLHQTALDFLKSEIKIAQEQKKIGKIQKIIVTTHYVPTNKYYPEKYQESIIKEAFVVELDDFILKSEIDYWIHGHHHFNHGNFMLGNTKICTNQLGYVKHNEHEKFRWEHFIEV
ncbi:metallophosphoesterase [Capnocytophaga canimorsus]|uniref:metallophosphoesterase n=1 Tax=Capnocytophaga canimorsus TaxID=28188 RepID=UPI001EE14630|nr:metallophosphoesterase [Capnocytophaga canimorsus]GJQ04867.1 metallophosphatase [Capnocytophaga canimorsus]